jgi:hypothetical protein
MNVLITKDQVPFVFQPQKDCDKNENTNNARADRAASSVRTYRRKGGYSNNGEFDPAIFQDLICDLCHFADREGLDLAECLMSGIGCYLQER